jgi:hypothetical protein
MSLSGIRNALRLSSTRLKRAAESRLARPDKDYVQGLWSRFIELWSEATDEERQKLMPPLVERVDMTEIEHGTCRLAFVPADPCPLSSRIDSVVSDSRLVAGGDLNPTYGESVTLGC